MMRRAALACLLVASIVPSSPAGPKPGDTAAPPKAGAVRLRPKLAAGQKYSFATVLERREMRPDGATPSLRIALPATLEIIGPSGDGWEMEWRDGKPTVSGESFDAGRLAAARIAIEASEGIGLRFRTDADGIALQVLNADEYSSRLSASLASIAATAPNEGDRSVAADLGTRLTRPDLVAMGALRTASLFLSSGGSNLAPGERVTVQSTLDNAFGGPPLPAELIVSLAPPADDMTSLSLSMSRRIDPVAGKDAVAATLTGLGVPPEAQAKTTLEIVEAGTWMVDRDTLLPRSLEHQRTMQFGPLQRAEKRTVRSIPSSPDPVPRRAIPPAVAPPRGQAGSP